ncbi:DUF6320 domain-containing protein [Clostridiaceae bacterium M8S5]|nr:DUF6320 domain-containing protein [Clostridiaceae bacterium M8S5]
MKHCKFCDVNIDDSQVRCPLCHKKLEGQIENEDRQYPQYNLEKIQKKNYRSKVFSFIVIIVISVCTLINLLNYNGLLWSFYVIFPLGYVWLSIRNTIISNMHYGVKILLQLIGLSFMLFMVDITNGQFSWSVDIVIPLLIITSIFIMTIIIYTIPMLWSEYIGYLFIIMFIGLIPIVLYLTNIAKILWPSAVSALYTLLTLIGMFIFSDKKLKNEFVRRFHI